MPIVIKNTYPFVTLSLTLALLSGPSPARFLTRDKAKAKESHAPFLNTLGSFDYIGSRRRSPQREPGTCEWITRHAQFRSWLAANRFSILWISGDPGCGKSVAASYLVDYLRETQPSSVLTTYFFFKDDSERQSKTATAVCSILHQILIEDSREALVSDAAKKFASYGENAETSFSVLWEILLDAIAHRSCGHIVLVLDALDECREDERKPFLAALADMERKLNTSTEVSLKILITSRPYASIQRALRGFQVIRVRSENNLDDIDEDIKTVVAARVARFASSIGAINNRRLEMFESKLLTKVDHTFLWVSLILDLLDQSDDCTYEEMDRLMEGDAYPSLDRVYHKILSKARNPEKVRRMLHLVVGAAEPLTPAELNIAWAASFGQGRMLDEEISNRTFPSPEVGIRETCGLFVRIIQNRVVLVHQTAKEFLVQNPKHPGAAAESCWKWSLDPNESARILAVAAAVCLLSNVVDVSKDRFRADPVQIGEFMDAHPFTGHASIHWLDYTLTASDSEQVVDLYVELLTNVMAYRSWIAVCSTHKPPGIGLMVRPLFLAIVMGHPSHLIRRLLEQGQEDVDATNHRGETALQVAASKGAVGTVECLLDHGADPSKDATWHGTPLHVAVRQGDTDMVRLLLSRGANRLARDAMDAVPLHHAVNPEIVDLLLTDLVAEQASALDWKGHTPLAVSSETIC